MRHYLRAAALTAMLLFSTVAHGFTVLAVGDSEILNARPGVPLASTFVQIIGTACGASTIVNAGVAGEDTSQTLARVPALLTLYDPDIVIYSNSPNNYAHGKTLAQTRSDLTAMRSAFAASGAKSVLFSHMLWADTNWIHNWYLAEQSMLFDFVGEGGSQYVNVFSYQMMRLFFTGYVPGAYNPPLRAMYAVTSTGDPDWIHPSASFSGEIAALALSNSHVCDH